MAGTPWTAERRRKMALIIAARKARIRKLREEEGVPGPLSDYPYEDRAELQRQGYAPHEDPDTYD
jgi:hypothetical protein